MRFYRIGIWVVLVLAMFAGFSRDAIAATFTVHQDGTGDYLTIPEAVAVAAPHDTILVGPGTYTEWVDVSNPLIFISETGAVSTIIDGEGNHRHMTFLAGIGSHVEGFTFRNGHYAGSGGSMRIMDGATVGIRDCVFEDNIADYDGGAIVVVKPGSSLEAEDCSFVTNSAAHNGGACNAIQGGRLNVLNCTFDRNETDGYCGALACDNGIMNVSGCFFYRNASRFTAGAIYCFESSGLIEGNTFYANISLGGATVYIQLSPGITLSQNIFAKEVEGFGLIYDGGSGAHSCNLFWDNECGPISGAALDSSEIEGDPLFCNLCTNDVAIAYSSPAAPGNNSCGVLIGAYPAACAIQQPRVITVHQDGTGDYFTIPEAVAAASPLDTILVGPGIYTESVDIACPLIFISEEGDSSTIMDGEGSHRHMLFVAGIGSYITGFTFRNGYYAGSGGSIRIMDGATVTIRDCIFEENLADYDGGAIIVSRSGSVLDVGNCSFISNSSSHNGGACNGIQGCLLSFSNCTFVQNSTGTFGAALACNDGNMNVSECFFRENTTGDVAGAIYCYRSTGSVESNTFYANASPGGATVFVQESPGNVVSQNIFAHDTAGFGLQYMDAIGTHTCNLYWDNQDGPIGGTSLDSSEIESNPLFCNVSTGDFAIAYLSLAAAGNNSCGVLIGAYPAACDIQQSHLIRVYQDGTGDYLTIPEAVAIAVPYDTILVGPGVYTEWVDISTPLIFISADGVSSTILDGESDHRHMTFLSGSGSWVEGFTFRNGHYAGSGGSMRIMDGATVSIHDCIFTDNAADYDGGAIIVVKAGSVLDAKGCSFINNSAPHNGGAANAIQGGRLNFSNCSFLGNTTGTYSAALACNDGNITVSECLFHGNASGNMAGAIYCYNSIGSVRSSTFHANASPSGAMVVIQESPSVIVSQNIFSNALSGFGLEYLSEPSLHSCNLFWANATGPINGDDLAPSEMQVNPFYCDPEQDNFSVAYTSPAAPGNNSCGLLIGAFPDTCNGEGIAPEPLIISIRDVPNDQGRQARIKWRRSLYDAPDDGIVITGYGIYRYQGEFSAGSDRRMLIPPDLPRRAEALDGWDFIETVPARGDSVYQYVAPTLCDSTINDGMCWSVFFVSAMTPDPLAYYDSAADSGYSLDNLAPAMPQGVEGQYDYAPNLLTVRWHPNTEGDLAGYRLYRGEGEDFVPSEGNLVASTPDTILAGLNYFPSYPWYFKVAAVDYNGNQSVYAVLPPSETAIATFVSSYQAIWKSGCVEVSWVLNEAEANLDFRVVRRIDTASEYEHLECRVIRDGDHFFFEDGSVESGKNYSYKVYCIEEGTDVLAFETAISIPTLRLDLKQNHPNPFNPVTTIEFTLPERMHVNLIVFDSQGKLIRTLLDETMGNGLKQIEWDGTDNHGMPAASGIYFYRMEAGKTVLTRKMVLLK